MNNFKVALAALAFSIGFLLGQWSTFGAINPEGIRNEAYTLAGLAYKYGCLRAKGNKCASYSYDFETGLRKQLPIDEIEGLE